MLYIKSKKDLTWADEGKCADLDLLNEKEIRKLTKKLGREPTEDELTNLNRGLVNRLFYPKPGEPAAPAKAICRTCPVRYHCLEYSLYNHEQYGIWGGGAARLRRRIGTQNKAAAQARGEIIIDSDLFIYSENED